MISKFKNRLIEFLKKRKEIKFVFVGFVAKEGKSLKLNKQKYKNEKTTCATYEIPLKNLNKFIISFEKLNNKEDFICLVSQDYLEIERWVESHSPKMNSFDWDEN